MGEAKRRGTFEQRKAAAIARGDVKAVPATVSRPSPSLADLMAMAYGIELPNSEPQKG